MEYKILNNLKPYCFFKWFGEICKIPHGSGNEKALVEFIEDYAEIHGFNYITDKMGNVYMNIPASKGYENEPPILFQAHLDMVCVKDNDINFDFTKDSLKLKIEDGKLYANGTSLGADNGVGVATMLALGDSDDILHPELEFLFTVEEETGLKGIKCFNLGLIKSRRMINMDCGDSHVIAISSLGHIATQTQKEFKLYDTENRQGIRLTVSGGLGGHPGLMALEGRASAGNIMGSLLKTIENDIALCEFKTNEVAILTDCTAIITTDKSNTDGIIAAINNRFSEIKTEFSKTDPDIKLETEACNSKTSISNLDTKNIIDFLCLIKTAPQKIEDGILITLSTLQKTTLQDGSFNLNYQIRFTDTKDGDSLYTYYRGEAQKLGFNTEIIDSCVGWSEYKGSPFREKLISVHKKLFGYTPEFERVLGGVEIAPIVDKIPTMDAVGIAPTARGAHTTKEHIILSETEDYWKWLLAFLREK